ncbi:hypothetical protein LXL04_012803 [Taraxacum kok-saghyz]
MDAGAPSHTTVDNANIKGAFTSGLGFFFVVFSLIIILSYGSYVYKRRMRFQSPPPTASFDATMDSDDDEYHFTRISTGIDDDVLATFPMFRYSEVVVFLNGETNTASHADNYASGCSICLGEYKPADVIRLLPECGHLFHVSCIDTWLRVHPTCPVCRNSPLPAIPADLT